MDDHPVRTALLELLADGPVTANEAARRLGESSGSCSFHLRQLARAGLVEEAPVPPGSGRRKPWQLRVLDPLMRDLEDEGYRRWRAGRDQVDPRWHTDDAASHVLWLTPDEMAAVAAALRRVAEPYASREQADARPPDARPVALVSRIFPLLPPEDDQWTA
ncbi:ArsR/SmtB family transcription factor [Cryptosporangium phraense]|uniref:Winged helix-turn-helix transcriptional regulator n=1 Tax=Cryptosporangium phraense TaxID=2593070 RepID=A0A545AHP6_9ACTN|nr:winged helix-turn-helix domain-containing protein [Cryptosporangium phraense]TQS40847.1 winged helix-turn-helix transcriptional regulator [Cryptosporangium phraense]